MLKTLMTNSMIANEIDKSILSIETRLVDLLVKVGKICLEDMERNRGYINVSGNLSDSRGFVVVKNKTIVYQSDFKSTEGGQKGKNLASERASQSNGISLIVVAGMEYAEHVEATGKNVYTSAELLAETVVPGLLNQLGLK